MNKEKFLTRLREYLSILENQEQEDILAEYTQHIDMKMQKGLSEEEAIRDFGPMEELAAEILEAYHVKPEFRRKGITLKLPSPGTERADNGESLWKRGLRGIKKNLAGIAHGIGRGFRWLGGKCRAAAAWFQKPFAGRKNKAEEEVWENGGNMEETKKKTGRFGNFCRAAGRGIVTLWGWFLAFCIFWLRLMWNTGWLVFSLFCACMAMIVLMGIGATCILLFQGYPLAGVFLVSLGGLLCLGTLSCGAFSMIIRKKKDIEDEGTDKSDEEVPYEQTA